MILQALKEYYDRKASDPDSDIAPRGWERKEIPFIILLRPDGQFVRLEDTREEEGKKRRGKIFLVPQGVKKTSGVAANLLWDVAGYIFGLDTKGKPARAEAQKMAFAERVRNEVGHIPSAKALVKFLEEVKLEALEDDALWEEIIETNPNLTFKILGDDGIFCNRKEIMSGMDTQENGEEPSGICLLTGDTTSISPLHTAIKGVNGAQTSGANIVSFNHDAFCSYYKHQGYNAPIGKEAADGYTKALNTLLSRGSRQRMIIGDVSTVFWSAKESSFESDFASFFSEPPKDNPDAGTRAIRSLFSSVSKGSYHEDDLSMKFYVLGLSPNAARLSVRLWHVGTIGDISEKIRRHYSDLAIDKPKREPEFYSLWRLLVNVASLDKSENIPPNLAGDLMKAVLDGTPYPAIVLNAALRRIHSDTDHRVKPVRAALIKAYLNRYHRVHSTHNHKEIHMSLDIEQPSDGYQLGRLFSALEKIQEDANSGLNATIRERYYGSACTSPITVFATLLRLANHHLAKMTSKGLAVKREKLLAEIMGRLSEFPAHLDLHEQGRFAMGYYHQRQSFFEQREKNAKGADAAPEKEV